MVCLEACLGLVLLVVVLIYFFGTRSFAWWDDQGVPYTRPWPFLGNLAPVVFQRSSYADCVTSLYERHCGVPLFGMFSLTSPSLVVKHPDLVQSVFKSRFESFPDRGILCDPENDPLSANLFFLPLERWKWLRAKLVPIFSSAKLRGIVPLLEMSSQNMVATMEQLVQSGKGCQEARSLFTQYSLRVIATCAFGMDETSYKSLEHDFSDTVRGVFSMKSRWGIQQLVRIFLPDLGRRLKLPFVRKDAEDFFMGVVKTEMEARRKDPQRRETRRDFLALLMDIDKDQKETKGEGLSDEMIAAQAFSFVVAGYESISSTLSFFFYNLAKNPDVQDKVRAEVVKSTADNPDDVYDAIAGMKYMEAAINESLRLYPPAGGIIRVCREDAVLECGGRAVLECGHQVIVPIQGIQRDPNHFPHPLLFDPDRFKERTPRPGTFCPFGDGQRICIAKRFAMIELKVLICHVLKRFRVSVNERTLEPLVMDPGMLLSSAKGGIWIDFQPI